LIWFGVAIINPTGKKIKEETMGTLATTRMSSKGQIVIPEEVRKRLYLKTGAQFVVVGEGMDFGLRRNRSGGDHRIS
jgi:AbrB family looped-hinge helix DNA binding protein